MALAAMVLLTLAVPRTVGVILSARAEPMLRKLQDQQPVRIDELTTLADAQEVGQFWLADGRVRTDLGLAYLLLAEKLPRGDPNAGAYLQRAIDALKAGLARAPANPYAWARLAYAEALAQGWSPLAVSSLRLSLITAPYEPRLLWSRLRMSFLAWPEMSSEDRELVFQQIRYAWQADPARTDAPRGRIEAGQPRARDLAADAGRRQRLRGIAEEAGRLSRLLRRDIPLTTDRPAVGCSSTARTPRP